MICPKLPNCILEGRRRARAKRPPAASVSPHPPAQASSSPFESRALKVPNPASDTTTPSKEGDMNTEQGREERERRVAEDGGLVKLGGRRGAADRETRGEGG